MKGFEYKKMVCPEILTSASTVLNAGISDTTGGGKEVFEGVEMMDGSIVFIKKYGSLSSKLNIDYVLAKEVRRLETLVGDLAAKLENLKKG